MSVFLVPGTTNLVPDNGTIILLVPFNFTFTNLGFTGANGPTSLNGYTTLPPGNLQLLNGIQYWTVPRTWLYYFKLAGAGSFNTSSANSVKSGNGVVLFGSYNLTAGTILAILVGQQGIQNGDAGGGTFIAIVPSVGNLASANPLFVAGGAGGPGGESIIGSNSTIDGTLSTTGRNGRPFPPTEAGAGGIGPDGGKVPTTSGFSFADGGGGFSGNGAWSGRTGSALKSPRSFVNGGQGGVNFGDGGFGGGAGFGNYSARVVGGGGGGYGGGGAGGSNNRGAGGGGGGSYDINGIYSGVINNLGSGYVTVSDVQIS